jgi:hypothetical protein
MEKLMLGVAVSLLGCASTITVRASSSDYLQKKGTSVTVDAPQQAAEAELDRLFSERGFGRSGEPKTSPNGQVIFYSGPRQVPRDVQDYGIQLGSWFAVRVFPQNAQTVVSIIGKPSIGGLELCSDNDRDLSDVSYTCSDTQVPKNWMGLNLITGRDEETVVSYVLDKLYERLK